MPSSSGLLTGPGDGQIKWSLSELPVCRKLNLEEPVFRLESWSTGAGQKTEAGWTDGTVGGEVIKGAHSAGGHSSKSAKYAV